MIQIKECPLCKNTSFSPFLICKDYTVSRESFSIVSCKSCNFKFTNPRPGNDEIGSYYKSEDYISHSDTKKGLVSRAYHFVRAHTLKRKLSLVQSYVSRGTILDYGCGTGHFLEICKDSGWKVFGMEPDEGARKIASKNGISVAKDKAGLLSKAGSGKFDVITLWHVLEHVTDLSETLTFFKDFLEERGALIIAVPNHTSFDSKLYKEFWAAYDLPRHLYHFEIGSITQLLKSYGFKLESTYPMKFDSFYVCMLSEKYKSGRINYLKAFTNGLLSNLKAKSAAEYSSVIYVFKKA